MTDPAPALQPAPDLTDQDLNGEDIELDEEVEAILTTVTALDALDHRAQRRVITYLADRYLFTPTPEDPTPTEPRLLRPAPHHPESS